MTTVVGIDGCKAGWIAVRRGASDVHEAGVFNSFAGVLDSLPSDAIVAVDMPIGLPDRITGGGRGPEQAVRRFLGARQSSVFSIPSRAAVHAEPGPFASREDLIAAHARASAVALRTSDPPRRISIQAFALFPKIREVDALLRGDPALAARIVESHPEAVFAALNGFEPMALPKKVKGVVNPPGMAERRALLAGFGLPPAFLVSDPPAGAAEDDFLDACVVMLAAERLARGVAVSHPSPPRRDAHGLPIAIWT